MILPFEGSCRIDEQARVVALVIGRQRGIERRGHCLFDDVNGTLRVHPRKDCPEYIIDVRDVDVVHGQREGVERGNRDLRTDLDLGGEVELALLARLRRRQAGNLRDVDGRLAERTGRIVADGRTFAYVLRDGQPRIVITQNDVRAIQLAKAALYAGARLLMDHAGVETVDEIRLAGAFGSQIELTHAMVLGLIPDCDLANARSAGNAAGTGALIALLSGAARAEIERVVRTVEKIETAIEPRFQEHFVDAMAFPHRTAEMPNLARVIDLPTRPDAVPGADPRAAQRRRRAPVAAGKEDR